MTQSTKSYAQFNVLTITGRVSHAELVDGKYGEFVAVTLLTELMNDTEAVAVQFNSTNGLLTLYKNGHLTTGRRLTVTGHLEGFSEIYFDKKLGKARRLQRPRLQLGKAQVLDGGLGPASKKESDMPSGDIEIDDAPEMTSEKTPAAAGINPEEF